MILIIFLGIRASKKMNEILGTLWPDEFGVSGDILVCPKEAEVGDDDAIEGESEKKGWLFGCLVNSVIYLFFQRRRK